jgi:hypothetical protein
MKKEKYNQLFRKLEEKVSSEKNLSFNKDSISLIVSDLDLGSTINEEFETYFENSKYNSVELLPQVNVTIQDDLTFLEAKVSIDLTLDDFQKSCQLNTFVLYFDSRNEKIESYFTGVIDDSLEFFVDCEKIGTSLESRYKLSASKLRDFHDSFGAKAVNDHFEKFLGYANFFTNLTIDFFEIIVAKDQSILIYDATPEALQEIELIPEVLVLKELFFTTLIKKIKQGETCYLTSSFLKVNAKLKIKDATYALSAEEIYGNRCRLNIEKEEGLDLPSINDLLPHVGLAVPSQLNDFVRVNIQSIEIVVDVKNKKIARVDVHSKTYFDLLKANFNISFSFPDFSYHMALIDQIALKAVLTYIDEKLSFKVPKLCDAFDSLEITSLNLSLSQSHQSFILSLKDVLAVKVCEVDFEIKKFEFRIHHFSKTSKTEVYTSGVLLLFGLNFEFRGRVDSNYSFDATLETELTLEDYQAKIESSFNIHLPFSLPQLALERFELACSTNKTFKLQVSLQSFTLHDLGVELDILGDTRIINPYLEISYGPENKFYCEVRGGLEVKGFSFDIRFVKKEDGFIFVGEIENDYALKDLGYFAEDIKKVIPQSVQDLTVRKIAVGYNSIEKKFNFYADVKDLLRYDFNLGLLEKISVDDCQFHFQIKEGKPNINLHGNLSINDTALLFNSDLSPSQGLVLSAHNLDVVSLNLKDISNYFLGELGVWTLVPEYFQSIDFKKIEFIFKTSPLSASLNIETKQLGDLYGGIGKLDGNELGILFSFFPPARIPFSQINKDFGFLEGFDFTGSSLIMSSYSSQAIEKSFLPDRMKKVDFIQGLMLSAALSLNSDAIQDQDLKESIKFFRENILDVQNLTVKATLGLDLDKLALEAYVGKIALGGTTVEIEKAGLRISAALDFTVFGSLSLDLREYIGLQMSFSLYLKVNPNGVVGYGIWKGDLGTKNIKQLSKQVVNIEKSISNLIDDYDKSQNFIRGNEFFNSELFHQIEALPDLQITKLGLVLGIDYEGIPSFGFIGEFNLNGDKREHGGIVAFVFDSSNPSKCMIDLKFPQGTQKALQDLFYKFPFMALTYPQLALFLKEMKFGGYYESENKWVPLRLKFALTDVRIGDVFYNKGILAQGRIGLLENTFELLFNLKVDVNGFKGFGKLKKIDLKVLDQAILKISQAKAPVKFKDKVLNSDLNELLFDGPYVSLEVPFNSPTDISLKSNAHVEFLGVTADLASSISNNGFFFKFTEKFPIGNIDLDVSVKSLTNISSQGHINIDIDIEELFINAKAKGQGGISLQGTDLLADFNFDLSFKDPISQQMITVSSLHLKLTVPPVIVAFMNNLVEHVKNEVLKVGAAIFDEIKKELEELVKEIKDLVEEIVEIGKEIESRIHAIETLEINIQEIATVIKIIKQGIESVESEVETLKQDIQELDKEISDLLEEISKLNIKKAADIANQIPQAVVTVLVDVLKIVQSVDEIGVNVLSEGKNHFQREWDRWEGYRVVAYHERMRLKKEYDDNWWKPWAWGHPAKMLEKLADEGQCEHMKFHCTNIIEMISKPLSILTQIDDDLDSVTHRKKEREAALSDKKDRHVNLNETIQEKKNKVDSEEAEKAEKNKELLDQEAQLQASRGNNAEKENYLAKKREKLEGIKEKFAQNKSYWVRSSKETWVSNNDSSWVGMKS